MEHQTAEHNPRRFLLPSLAVLATVLALGGWGYWQYVTAVPAYRPKLPPPPRPNGYDLAVAAVRQGKARDLPPMPERRVGDTLARLRSEIAPWRDVLDRVRKTLPLEWQAPIALSLHPAEGDPYRGLADLRACARAFAAEACLARLDENPSLALDRGLDAIELGSRASRGGGSITYLSANAMHANGVRQAEQDALNAAADAVPMALERVRRTRRNRLPLHLMWGNERITTLAVVVETMNGLRQASLREQFLSFGFLQTQPSVVETARVMLRPRRRTIAAVDQFFRQRIAEARKPFPRRRPVPVPADPWCEAILGAYREESLGRYESPLNGLALLDAALAVRMHRLTRGRWPERLAEIDRRWLPAIPRDQWDRPVVYRLRDGRPVLYSLGLNGTDEGGRAVHPTRFGAASHGDLVFGRLTPLPSAPPPGGPPR